MDLFERWPGSDLRRPRPQQPRAPGRVARHLPCAHLAEWIAFADEHNTTIAPVNTPKTIADDPQFQDRFDWIPADILGAEQLPFPVKLVDESLPPPAKAPTLGEHTDEVLRDVLRYTDDRIGELRQAGALGKTE
jgi:crotonobetainyl-CoA:carnitine CoA-transferase CaiB-like acyl-CoA transferase